MHDVALVQRMQFRAFNRRAADLVRGGRLATQNPAADPDGNMPAAHHDHIHLPARRFAVDRGQMVVAPQLTRISCDCHYADIPMK